MNINRKYLGKLYEVLSVIQQNLILKQQRMEEISMSDVQKMWELKSANGETVQMDLSWVASTDDISNLIKSIDGLKSEIAELQYGDMDSLANTCVADWQNISRNINNRTIYDVYGYKGNLTNIIIPAKLNKPSAYGCLNASYTVASGGTPTDKYKLGNASTKKIAFIGDFVSSVSYWKEFHTEEFIGLEKVIRSMNQGLYTTPPKFYISKIKELDLRETSVNTGYSGNYKTWDNYYIDNPSKSFGIIAMFITPALETVIFPSSIKDAIDNLITGEYDLMSKMHDQYPNFKEFIYV